MEAYAKTKYVRISPRKVKVVLDLIRGKDAGTAMAILKHTPKAASESLIKLLKSACANAEHNFDMDSHNLVVSKCWVTPGPTLKRMMPRAKGRGDRILKRTSHITICVAEKE
ncbi:MAG: 50S ribosomal protein L22 [Oscillospiraceae bacterium]|jgi:ribosomal protein L22|nr:MAG: 50S ribosomal protein L22 [Oscillospiraceae bacterium]